jgi:hypothetical protein
MPSVNERGQSVLAVVEAGTKYLGALLELLEIADCIERSNPRVGCDDLIPVVVVRRVPMDFQPGREPLVEDVADIEIVCVSVDPIDQQVARLGRTRGTEKDCAPKDLIQSCIRLVEKPEDPAGQRRMIEDGHVRSE